MSLAHHSTWFMNCVLNDLAQISKCLQLFGAMNVKRKTKSIVYRFLNSFTLCVLEKKICVVGFHSFVTEKFHKCNLFNLRIHLLVCSVLCSLLLHGFFMGRICFPDQYHPSSCTRYTRHVKLGILDKRH